MKSVAGQRETPRNGRGALALAALLAFTSLGIPGSADASGHTVRLVKIPASFPDRDGNPVLLDASVAIPGPAAGPPPYPAIVLNHGLTGSRTSDGGLTGRATDRGYIVLRYSARGHGDTPGEIDLMGYKETQDLLDAINWLNDPANVPEIQVDSIAQMGGSYGAAHGMMLATLNHPAVKAIAPFAGYIDFYRGLAPGDVPKALLINFSWLATVLLPEPENRWSEDVHRAVVSLNTGVDMEGAKQIMHARSALHRMGNIRTPMYLVQGWNDSFFAAEEFIEAYEHLRARGIPAALYLGGIGHPPSNPDTNGPEARHIAGRVFDWFDYWVKGIDNDAMRRPPIEISTTSWAGPAWDGTTMRASSLPFGAASPWHLCPGLPAGSLSPEPCAGDSLVALHNTYATANPSGEPLSAGFLRDNDVDLETLPRTSSPLDTAVFVSEPLEQDTLFAGTPRFDLDVVAAGAGVATGPGPVMLYQLDPRIYEVAPDGTETLVTRGAYSESLDEAPGPRRATFDAYGFAYRFRAGHRIKVVLATNDAPFLKPAPNPFTVVVRSGSVLDLPGSEGLF